MAAPWSCPLWPSRKRVKPLPNQLLFFQPTTVVAAPILTRVASASASVASAAGRPSIASQMLPVPRLSTIHSRPPSLALAFSDLRRVDSHDYSRSASASASSCTSSSRRNASDTAVAAAAAAEAAFSMHGPTADELRLRLRKHWMWVVLQALFTLLTVGISLSAAVTHARLWDETVLYPRPCRRHRADAGAAR